MSNNSKDEKMDLSGDEDAQTSGGKGGRSLDEQGVALPGDENPCHISGKGG